MKRLKGFTLIELLVVIAIISLLLSIVLPSIGSIRELGRRTACRNNLKSVGVGLTQYTGTSDMNGPFPILDRTFTNPHADLSQSTGADDANLCSSGGAAGTGSKSALGENAMQNMWLLMKAGMAEERHFRCPSDTGWTARLNAPGKQVTWRYGWGDLSQFSYGIQYPYDPNGNANPACPYNRWNSLNERLVIMADRNPGGSVQTISPIRKPSNHPDGEAILYRGLSADFYESKQDSKASYQNDDIYVNSDGQVGAVPKDKADAQYDPGTDVNIVPYPSRSR
jgi:prepilin-type N-terminal cleavage/methylation domain-containing protein